ncbi:hypothetical protein TraAM80_07332 [Trypanosoma rangeli]|uniref:Uncharacterized protein n=1 Tax=Trypanosoma rangeli TaxID=5698 RepID=A0A422N5Y4_TRYRA|nr:uncharacterized protein TraAM80_07332 [Trypanosoma rangeli]RNF00869.1 hypothetical protein TraAM80_07332 [Trypanosoma rangeli]|eukprot:RNF00869.1 hypothetical protein TraAM80_07332 [Trypanosoma rangeli]
MTERSLMIRHALAGRYFAVGMDFPSARVFDVATGSLAAVVEMPPRSRTSLAVVSLTALALGTIATPQSAEEKVEEEATNVVGVAGVCYAAVGLSNGTMLLQNVARDEVAQHLAVSDTQQAITAAVFCGQYLFCVATNRSLCAIDCLRGESVASHLRVQHDVGAIAVMEGAAQDTQHGSHAKGSVFLVFVSGPTNAVYTLRLSSSGDAQNTGATMERLVCFASQASRSDFAWMGGNRKHPVVVTASAQEGVVRVWDASSTVSSQTTSARCRRSLLCGQRILDVSVHDPDTTHNSMDSHRNGVDSGEAFVVATTLTGAVLVWNLGNTLLTSLADPVLTPPTLRIVSKEISARLLFGAFMQSEAGTPPPLLVLRGRFAMPHFEVVDLREAMRKASTTSSTAAAVSVLVEDGAVYEMPAGSQAGKGGGIDAVHADMEVIDHAWVTHCRQQLLQQQRLAARATHTPSEGFVSPVSFHAKSVKDIPQKSLTLEQRLKQMSLASTASSQQQQQQQQHALGLATVPLYQALHACDASAVMELLTVASRSAADIRATVMGLQLPYCLQLLQILAQRVRGANSRSPLFGWIDAIVQYRGVEMYQTQQLFKQQQQQQQQTEKQSAPLGSSNNGVDGTPPPTTASEAATSKAKPSPPKDFVAPLLHQYRNMTALYDPLAAMYGRLSIFKSVRPSERGAFANSDAGIIFPAMFTEIRCAGGEYRALRVRSKRDPHSSKNKKRGAMALLRKAQRLAAVEEEEAAAANKMHAGADDDADEEDLDMDALAQMNLDEDTSEEAEATPGRRAREKQAEMIAEVDRGSSYGIDASTRSSEAEFDTASDDDVHSAADGDSDSDDEEDDDSSSSSSGVSDADMMDADDDEEYGDDEDEAEDGMGEDMAELLQAQGEEEQLEERRHKRVRTDH